VRRTKKKKKKKAKISLEKEGKEALSKKVKIEKGKEEEEDSEEEENKEGKAWNHNIIVMYDYDDCPSKGQRNANRFMYKKQQDATLRLIASNGHYRERVVIPTGVKHFHRSTLQCEMLQTVFNNKVVNHVPVEAHHLPETWRGRIPTLNNFHVRYDEITGRIENRDHTVHHSVNIASLARQLESEYELQKGELHPAGLQRGRKKKSTKMQNSMATHQVEPAVIADVQR